MSGPGIVCFYCDQFVLGGSCSPSATKLFSSCSEAAELAQPIPTPLKRVCSVSITKVSFASGSPVRQASKAALIALVAWPLNRNTAGQAALSTCRRNLIALYVSQGKKNVSTIYIFLPLP